MPSIIPRLLLARKTSLVTWKHGCTRMGFLLARLFSTKDLHTMRTTSLYIMLLPVKTFRFVGGNSGFSCFVIGWYNRFCSRLCAFWAAFLVGRWCCILGSGFFGCHTREGIGKRDYWLVALLFTRWLWLIYTVERMACILVSCFFSQRKRETIIVGFGIWRAQIVPSCPWMWQIDLELFNLVFFDVQCAALFLFPFW